MKIGIVDLLAMPAANWTHLPYRLLLTKQYASIMPQAIAVWCRQLGHEVHYATYYGYGDPTQVLPEGLDVVFIASFTHVSPLAYALAKLYRRRGAMTVIGGPHARAFPEDCLRFFDLVVGNCDRALIEAILSGQFARPSQIASEQPLSELPSVEERWPYIKQSSFLFGRRYFATTVPMLGSVGCPYSCDFCIDWNTRYRLLPTGPLEADLQFLAREAPGVRVTFHDPNFAIGWDAMLDSLETIPPGLRSPIVVESSLASLRDETRLRRLRDARCIFVCAGIESWAGYSGKAGAGSAEGAAKVASVVEQMTRLSGFVPYLQASFVFGLDTDEGEAPIEATKEFMAQTPAVWPAINIPQPFGTTPLFATWQREGRLLETLPFYFYQMPFLTTLPRHYDPMDYYRRVIDLHRFATSADMLRRRLRASRMRVVQAMHATRTMAVRGALASFSRTLEQWCRDRQVLAFHHRETQRVPEVYERILARALGPLSNLLTRADLTPVLPAMA